MFDMKAFFGPMRVPFLLLTPACVAVGWGTAVWTSHHVDIFQLLIVLIGAVASHISVNAFNEYFDYRSGLDTLTHRTPFSGGSGSLQAAPFMAPWALGTAIGSFIIVCAVGVWFVYLRGAGMLLIGGLGAAVVLAYSLWFVKRPVLCLIAPGLGFGTFMVIGTNYALTGHFSWTALVASMVPFFLVSNLLLLNQFPDTEPDKTVGRRHLPIVIGRKASSIVYGLFLLFCYLSIIAGILTKTLPLTAAIGLLTFVVAVPAFLGSYRNADTVAHLVPSMGLNVIINILTPVLLAVGLLTG